MIIAYLISIGLFSSIKRAHSALHTSVLLFEGPDGVWGVCVCVEEGGDICKEFSTGFSDDINFRRQNLISTP